jgi:hypothetical protein
MTSNLYVHFDLGDYEDKPELESFSVDPDSSDIRVKKEEGNFCELVVQNTTYRTNELELEMSGGGWMASASFEIPVTRDVIDDLRNALSSGQAKLRLGQYEFKSNAADNEYLFRENYFDLYGN